MSEKSEDAGPEDFKIDDPDEFARNLAEVAKRSATLASLVANPSSVRAIEEQIGDNVSEGLRTFAKVAEAWVTDPRKLLEEQAKLWTRQFDLWQATMRRVAGGEAQPVAEPSAGDRRFQDPEWRENPFFDFLKQSYLISAAWAEQLVDDTSGLDPHTRHKAGFYVRQLANAFSPTNFLVTNPEVLRETLATNGRNLVKGIDNLAEDIERGRGELRVRQTDLDAFKVGENVATTPGKVIFQNEIFQLIQYAPTTETVFRTPLLIVPPWINKFYILDLTAEKSFIKWVVDAGHTVLVVSWVNPDERLAKKSFESYMREGILTALDATLEATGAKRANVIGYCVGGTLLAATLSYLVARKDRRIASATFLATQVDFTHAGDLKVFVDDEQLETMERQVERQGYLAGASMARTFNLLRSNDLIWSYVINNYLMGRDPFPFDLLYWNSDSTRMPATNHLFYLRECYGNNALAKGEMVLDGTRLDLGKVKVPVYTLATREDHIAPALSVFNGSRLFGGPVRYVVAGSGHIAGVVNPPVREKYEYWADGTGDTFDEWMASARETPGSWWPDWQQWIAVHAGSQVPARVPGAGPLKAIEDAPGSYVKVRAD